ncbi:hypothetical protein FHS36_002539 [Streptomyces eurocidicus]|uniref:Uncharacterized protein n=1 Tax=Streptomyces eurocidicus TaxID=66423 RepID=A0A7W8B979_STREU|nr:hypothetical protein [Streptomyces eurocidicus]
MSNAALSASAKACGDTSKGWKGLPSVSPDPRARLSASSPLRVPPLQLPNAIPQRSRGIPVSPLAASASWAAVSAKSRAGSLAPPSPAG